MDWVSAFSSFAVVTRPSVGGHWQMLAASGKISAGSRGMILGLSARDTPADSTTVTRRLRRW